MVLAYRVAPQTAKQCCVKVNTNPYYSDSYATSRAEAIRIRNGNPRHCANSAKYVIAGKLYCKQHAGSKALEILLKDLED